MNARDTIFLFMLIKNVFLQEPTSEKTNNGIHYKLQLLYSNGELSCVHLHHKNKPTTNMIILIII